MLLNEVEGLPRHSVIVSHAKRSETRQRLDGNRAEDASILLHQSLSCFMSNFMAKKAVQAMGRWEKGIKKPREIGVFGVGRAGLEPATP